MKKLNRYLLILGLILAANIANAAVTLLSGNREGDTDGYNDYTPLRMNAPAGRNAGACDNTLLMICSGETIVTDIDECINLNFRSPTPVECCNTAEDAYDADPTLIYYDCFPLCDDFQEKYREITLFPNIMDCKELNGFPTGYACQTEKDETAWKVGCTCEEKYSRSDPGSCPEGEFIDYDEDGEEDDPKDFACKAGGIDQWNRNILKYPEPKCSERQCTADTLYTLKNMCIDTDGNHMNITPCKDSGELKYECSCTNDYKTLDDFCRVNGEDDCKNKYIAITDPNCRLDGETKYSRFEIGCPVGVTTVSSEAECSPGIKDYECYQPDDTSYFVCKCKDDWKTLLDYCAEKDITDNTTCKATYKPQGDECTFDGENKYGSFIRICPTGRDFQTSPTCENGDQGLACDDNGTTKYMCECPDEYKTFEEFCNEIGDGCATKYVPFGETCTLENASNPKYKEFRQICPNDRPAKISEAECTSGLDFKCADGNTEKFVCKCPDSWYDDSNCNGNLEPAGNSCDFESYTNKKYELCLTMCDKLSTNGKGIEYLDEAKPSETSCRNKLGDGATYGASSDEPRCSENNEIKYPCYCGANYKICDISKNEIEPDNPITCTIGGTTYYNQCEANDCNPKSSTIAIIDDDGSNPNVRCAKAGYGTGATGRQCGLSKIECTCDTSTYNDLCKYPLSVPDNTNTPWCKYGDGSTLMENGTPHYKHSDCSRKQILGKCGEYILNSDGSHNYSVTIHVTASDTLCTSQYGTGATPVLCEYSDNPNRRAYNCWYDEREFIWTENNCPIRHVFGKRFIYRNKLKHYDTCDCHPNYKYHKFNCSKKLSGAACVQKLTTKQLSSDNTLQSAVDQGKINVGQNIQLYGYCK